MIDPVPVGYIELDQAVPRLAETKRMPSRLSTPSPKPTAPKYDKAVECLTKDRDALFALRRSELHDDGSWRLPGTRTKNRRPHVVPLPALAQAIIAAVPPAGDHVFVTSAGRPATNWSAAKAKLDRAMLAIAQEERGPSAAIEAFRLHDLRRTAVTGVAELNEAFVWAGGDTHRGAGAPPALGGTGEGADRRRGARCGFLLPRLRGGMT